MHVGAASLGIAASWVGLVSLAAGLLLVRQRTARGPPHPFTSAFVSGLLIGLSILVVLPEAIDRLPECGWTSSQVLLVFLGSAAFMFLLDHAVMEHQHVMRGEQIPSADGVLDPSAIQMVSGRSAATFSFCPTPAASAR